VARGRVREQGAIREAIADTALELLPGPRPPVAELQATLDRWAALRRRRAVYGPGGELLARWAGRCRCPTTPARAGTGRASVATCCSLVRLADGRGWWPLAGRTSSTASGSGRRRCALLALASASGRGRS
jgi:hypothetical protein